MPRAKENKEESLTLFINHNTNIKIEKDNAKEENYKLIFLRSIELQIKYCIEKYIKRILYFVQMRFISRMKRWF